MLQYRIIIILSIAVQLYAADIPLYSGEKDIARWSGASLDALHTKNGPSMKWDGAGKGRQLLSTNAPSDWSGVEALSFSLFTASDNGAEFMIQVISSNTNGEGDYYFYRFKPIPGWQDISMPLKKFQPTRSPVGWHKVDKIVFNSFGWGIQPKADTAVSFGAIVLTGRSSIDGLALLYTEKDIERWSGCSADTASPSDKPSFKWDDAAKGGAIASRSVPRDWSKYGELRYRFHAGPANDAEYIITIVSSNENGAGDYFLYRVKPIPGWQDITIPLTKFSRSRNPKGWHSIDRVTFNASGWDLKPRQDTAWQISGITVGGNAQMTPQLSAEDSAAMATTKKIQVALDRIEPWGGKLVFPDYPWEEIFKRAESDKNIAAILGKIVDTGKRTAGGSIITRVYALKDVLPAHLDGRAKNAGPNEETFALAMSDCNQNGFLFNNLVVAAIAARRTDNRDIDDFIIRQLTEVVEHWKPLQRPGWTAYTPTRKLGPRGDGVWLATGWGVLGIVNVLTIMGDRVPKELKAKLRVLLQEEIDRIMADYKDAVPWYVSAKAFESNQWIFPLTALAAACLYLGDEKNRDAYEFSVLGLSKTCLSQGDSGSFAEGFAYATMTTHLLFMAMFPMKLAGDARLARYPFARNFSTWYTQMHMPGRFTVNAFDCGTARYGTSVHPLYLFATLVADDKAGAWTAENLFGEFPSDWASLVYSYYAPKIPGTMKPPANFSFFSDQQILTWRTGWDINTDIGLWLRGGSHNNFHIHRDNGQVSIYNGIRPVIVESGTPGYATPGFDDIFANVKGHSILQTPGAKPRSLGNAATPIVVHRLDDSGGSATIIGTEAYTDVASWRRKVDWTAQGTVTITDKAVMKAERPAGDEWFRFHTGTGTAIDVQKIGPASYSLSWEHVSIAMSANRPFTITVIDWSNAVLTKVKCLSVRSAAAYSDLELTTALAITRVKNPASDDAIPYGTYLKNARAPAAGNAAGETIILQAEDMIQTAIGIKISDRKKNAKVCILNWDNYGDLLTKEIDVSSPGFYRIAMKYCTSKYPRRAIIIDGKVPFKEAGNIAFDSTQGPPPSDGFANNTDDWKIRIIGDGSDTGFLFYLSAGRHTLSFMQLGESLNADWIALIPEAMDAIPAAGEIDRK